MNKQDLYRFEIKNLEWKDKYGKLSDDELERLWTLRRMVKNE